MDKKPNGRETDWGNEVAGALKFAGRMILKFFSLIITVIMTILLIGLITVVIVGGAFAIYISSFVDASVDDFDKLSTSQNLTTRIYYMDYEDPTNRINGVPVEIEDQRLDSGENSLWASYQSMPKNLVNAFIAVEDKRFWQHSGVDWRRTASATFYFLIGKSSHGGSTITQQLIKNVTEEDDNTIQRKVQEIFRALNLEKIKDKTEILELYLNNIFLSQRCYGVQAAAYKYFGKDVSELTLIECAAIAGITQFPPHWDPYINPDNNARRRNAILELMLEQELITQQEFDSAYGKDLDLNMQGGTIEQQGTTSWYTDQVIEDAITLLGETYGYTEQIALNMIYSGGLQIYTAMDPEIQNILEEIYVDDSNFPYVEGLIQPESAFVIIDPSTGDVLGIAGGRGEKEAARLLNYATMTTRSPGSSLKPISVYAPALEYGYITYGSVLDDSPLNFGDTIIDEETGKEVYENPVAWPKNLPAVYRGLTTINSAVTRSVNTVSLRTLQRLGLDLSFDFVKNKLHIDSFIESATLANGIGITDKDYAALALGAMNYGLTVQEITAAYSIFVNDGVYTKPRTIIKILDSEGEVLIDNDVESSIVMSAANASIMTKMLQNVVTVGTATAITLDETIDVAGKTGTTSSDNDKWFVGYTPYYVGGIWFGYSMQKSLSSFPTSTCVTIWDKVMTRVHQRIIDKAAAEGTELESFELTSDVVKATYCMDSGKLITDACKADPRGNRAEVGYFTRSTVPTQTCDCHVLVEYCSTGHGIASEMCPDSDIVKVGLIQAIRDFPVQVPIVDAQYIYRPLLSGVLPYSDSKFPFFQNLLEEGHFAGISENVEYQYNRYCPTHYDPNAAVQETTGSETLDPDFDYDPAFPPETNEFGEIVLPPVVTPPDPVDSDTDDTDKYETEPEESYDTEAETLPDDYIW
ncbi:MAG: transglycosylase domain-containing protein [Clostridia bacterium]|nr:transglycosylase domain-containing protein [Clostridia bacterium]